MEPRVDQVGASTGNLRSYATGFLLAIALTIGAFALVVRSQLPRSIVITGLVGAAVAQVVVHLHYFLHLDRSSAVRRRVLILIFTLAIMTLFVTGALWIMHSLDYRMMG